MSLTYCVKKILLSYLTVLFLVISASLINFIFSNFMHSSGSLSISKVNFHFTIKNCDIDETTEQFTIKRIIGKQDPLHSEYKIQFYREFNFQYNFEKEMEHTTELVKFLNDYGCDILASNISKQLDLAGTNEQLLFFIALTILSLTLYLISAYTKGYLHKIFHTKIPEHRAKQFFLFAFIGACTACFAMMLNIALHYFGIMSQKNSNSLSLLDFKFAALLATILLGSLVEELVFRRLGYQIWMGETRKAKIIGALLISSLFALFHSGIISASGFNYFMFFISYMCSLILCYAYVKGGFFASSACDIAFNLTSITISFSVLKLFTNP